MYVTYDVALEVVRLLKDPLAIIAEHDAGLADQIRRASQNAVLNIAEARGRDGKDRKRVLRIAHGEARETVAGLDLSLASSYVGDNDVAPARASADRLCGLLWPQTR